MLQLNNKHQLTSTMLLKMRSKNPLFALKEAHNTLLRMQEQALHQVRKLLWIIWLKTQLTSQLTNKQQHKLKKLSNQQHRKLQNLLFYQRPMLNQKQLLRPRQMSQNLNQSLLCNKILKNQILEIQLPPTKDLNLKSQPLSELILK